MNISNKKYLTKGTDVKILGKMPPLMKLRSASKVALISTFVAIAASSALAQECIDPAPLDGPTGIGLAPSGWSVYSETPDVVAGEGKHPHGGAPDGTTFSVDAVSGASSSGGTMGFFLAAVEPSRDRIRLEAWQTTFTGLTVGQEYKVAVEWQQAAYLNARGELSRAGGSLKLAILNNTEQLFTSNLSYDSDTWSTAAIEFTANATSETLVVGADVTGGLIIDEEDYYAAIVVDSGTACASLTTSENVPPSISNFEADAPSFNEGGPVVRLDVSGDATGSDAEFDLLNAGNGDYAGGSVTVSRSGGANSDDILGFDTTGAAFTVSGSALQSGGATFATFTNTGGVLTINFTSSDTTATTALVSDVLQHITYDNDSTTPPASIVLDVSLSDGTSADTVSVTLNVTRIAPVVTSVTMPPNKTYSRGEPLDFTVNFSDAIDVTGTPRIAIDVGGVTKYATYVSGTSDTALVFRYTPDVDDLDTDGIEVGALELNGGTLQDAGDDDANLTLTNVGATPAVSVDAVSPLLSATNPSDDGTNVAADIGRFRALFNESVYRGTGFIRLYKVGDATPVQVFDVTDIEQVDFDGNEMTVYSVNLLLADTAYYITIDPTAIKDGPGNPFAGIANNTTWNFNVPPLPPFSDWPNPAEVCTGSINHANFNGKSAYFGTGLIQGDLPQIYDDVSTSQKFVSPFIEVNGRPAYKSSAPVAIGSATTLPTSSGDFYQPGIDVSGFDVAVYSFRVEARGNQAISIPYGDSTSVDDMLITVEATDGTVLTSRFIGEWSTSGTLDVTMPSDGVAFLRYYVIDLGGGYGSVLDGGCAIADQTGPVISGPSGEPGDANAAVSMLENATAVTQLRATDDNSFTWSVAANALGYDNDLFIIDANGNLAFKVAPDFEAPADQGIPSSSNTYLVQVVATDSFGNVSTQDITLTVTDVDEVPPVITGPSGGPGNAIAAISVNENQSAVTQVSANESVTWSITGSDDDAKFQIAANGTITFVTTPDYENANDVGDTAGNNTYVLTVTATDSANNTSIQAITVTVLDLWDSLPGTVNGVDADGDGIENGLESATADRDGDGTPDASDYDPQGYFYCEDDGRILSGGSISVTGPNGSNSAVGTSNNIRIVKDGSDGQYQWFATAAGTYTMSMTYPSSVGVPSTRRTSSGTLDVTTLLPENPASIGSSAFGNTGFLSNYWNGGKDPNVADNVTTTFYTTFVIAEGDPNVIGNNIPVAQCGENDVAIAKITDGAEANGGSPTAPVFTVSQSRESAEDTIVSYTVDEGTTATSGADFTPLTGSVTIPAGQLSASITVSVLEDRSIEGDEVLVLTLTGIASGDLTTQLTDVVGGRSARAIITDDDSADVTIANDDLNTTEGRDDPAVMRLSLGGQPSGPVTLTFTGDAQCSVSPSTLTFDATNFATPQTLRIHALNDEVVEGAHSCRPTVVVSSTDTRFNGLSVTLATVTIADDLVDQIRNPLTNILQSDFQQTVATQSRQFGQISKGALGRLQDEEDLHCGDIEALDVDGTAKAGEGAFNTSGTVNEDTFNCVTGVRRITQGSFAVNSSPSIDTQGIFTLTVQNEKRVADNALRGFFYGGYLSSASPDGVATGNINGVGGHLGVYGANELNNGLLFDYYAAGTHGRHAFDLSFYAPTAPVQAEGAYRYNALYVGAALSGEVEYDSVTFRPRSGINLTYADASDADVSATQLGITDTGRIELNTINGTRLFAEAIWAFGQTVSADEIDEAFARTLEFAPRVYCEQGLGRDTNVCGYGGYISFNERNDSNRTDMAVTLDYESSHESSSYLGLEFSYSRDILDGAGALVTKFGGDHLGNAGLSQHFSFTF